MKIIEDLIDDLIEAAEWKGANEQIGYMAGDKLADEDRKEVADAKAALLARIDPLAHLR